MTSRFREKPSEISAVPNIKRKRGIEDKTQNYFIPIRHLLQQHDRVHSKGSSRKDGAVAVTEGRAKRPLQDRAKRTPPQMISFLISLSRRVQSDAFLSCGLKEAGQCGVGVAPGTTRQAYRAGRQRQKREWNFINETYLVRSPFGPDHGR